MISPVISLLRQFLSQVVVTSTSGAVGFPIDPRARSADAWLFKAQRSESRDATRDAKREAIIM